MRKIYALLVLILIVAVTLGGLAVMTSSTVPSTHFLKLQHKVGDTIDSYNQIPVIYNGAFGNNSGRHLAKDGYNYGLSWQCVEYIKRYYYDYYQHKMPDTYGHAKDFFDKTLNDGEVNKQRGLKQYTNGSLTKPKAGDILVLDKNIFNPYGHVAIIVSVSDEDITVIQQNVGAKTRSTFLLKKVGGKWKVLDNDILGWLSKY